MLFLKNEVTGSSSSTEELTGFAPALQTTRFQSLPYNELYLSSSSGRNRCKTQFHRTIFRLTSVSFLTYIMLVTIRPSTITAFSTSGYQQLQFLSTGITHSFKTHEPVSKRATYFRRPFNRNSKQHLQTHAQEVHHQKLLHDLKKLQSRIRDSVEQTSVDFDWNSTLNGIQKMFHLISEARQIDKKPQTLYVESSKILDETINFITAKAFSKTYLRSNRPDVLWEGVKTALDILDLQLSSKGNTMLIAPYNSVPKKTWLQALNALNLLVKKGKNRRTEKQFQQGDAAYLVLERLCTSEGVRASSFSSPTEPTIASSSNPKRVIMDERHFNNLLNGFVNVRRMDMAERVVSLQYQTEHAPPLSPVTFSILLKGYGKEKDLNSVGDVWTFTRESGLKADTILYNSLIDAYVNCGEIERAYDTFCQMTKPKNSVYLEKQDEEATPNVRTYNIMLKGFARAGEESRAMQVTQEMMRKKIWDNVSTNTLVSVLVSAGNFELAESILTKYTTTIPDVSHRRPTDHHKQRTQHPNVEAYTDLLNGYGKSGMYREALSTLRTMRDRGIKPNQHTYSCMIASLAKAQKFSEAKKMLDFMELNDGIAPSIITYNAFLSAMLEEWSDDSNYMDNYDTVTDLAFNGRVDEAINLIKRMMKSGTKPNTITITTIVDAFARCNPPRLNEAKAFVNKFDELGIVPLGSNKVSTAMIRLCAVSQDFKGAYDAFKIIAKPDIIAYNVFLDACCRCGQTKMALDTFRKNSLRLQRNEEAIAPDVATYTILLSQLLKIGNSAASVEARRLYREMKQKWGIEPDKGLVDTVLIAMISGGNSLGLHEKDVHFTYEVLHDARKLDLPPDFLKKREKAVKAVIVGRMSEVWKEDAFAYGMSEGPLERRNWNQIDSRFRIWGNGLNIFKDIQGFGETVSDDTDEFLESKNWNSMNSGFRLF